MDKRAGLVFLVDWFYRDAKCIRPLDDACMCVRMRVECNVIQVMGYTRVASRYDYARVRVGACTRVRAIGVTPSFPVRLTIPAVMLAIKDNDASWRFVKHAARFVITTKNESGGLISR